MGFGPGRKEGELLKEIKHLGKSLRFEFNKALLIVRLGHGGKVTFLGADHSHALGESAALDFLENMLTEGAAHIQLLYLCVVYLFTFGYVLHIDRKLFRLRFGYLTHLLLLKVFLKT